MALEKILWLLASMGFPSTYHKIFLATIKYFIMGIGSTNPITDPSFMENNRKGPGVY